MMAPARRRRIMEVSREDSARCARRGGRRGSNRASAEVGCGRRGGAGRGRRGREGRDRAGRREGRRARTGQRKGRRAGTGLGWVGASPPRRTGGGGRVRGGGEGGGRAPAAEERPRPRRRCPRLGGGGCIACIACDGPACVRTRPPPRPVAFSCLRLIARRGVGGLTKLRHESLRIKLQRGDADGSALRGRTRQQRGGWKDYAVARAMGWMGYAYGNNYKISLH